MTSFRPLIWRLTMLFFNGYYFFFFPELLSGICDNNNDKDDDRGVKGNIKKSFSFFSFHF